MAICLAGLYNKKKIDQKNQKNNLLFLHFAEIKGGTTNYYIITVLPGLSASTPLFGENTPLLHILLKFRYFSAISCYFLYINFEKKNTITVETVYL
jgi:hypothetical protein